MGARIGFVPIAHRPSPLFRRVGVHTFTFEACSGFTRVAARGFAQRALPSFVPRASAIQVAPTASRAATELNRQLLRWNFHPLETSAFVAH